MFENIRSRKRHGQAQVEYRACRKEVEEKFAAGYSSTMIYEELAAAGRLTVSYSAFCDYVRGGERRIHNHRPRASQFSGSSAGQQRQHLQAGRQIRTIKELT